MFTTKFLHNLLERIDSCNSQQIEVSKASYNENDNFETIDLTIPIKTNEACEIGSNVFTSGWALKENERKAKRQPVTRMTTHVKKLLEIMFHTGTANPSQKLIAQQMREELILRAQAGKINDDEIPKETTIQNWISGFSHRWKEAMALRALDETESSEPL
ncbi:hypothetical protein C2G38_2247491 [Gigaspora rosea]|uniref:Uncharacterized protein n=1 Tax=Gigaspora rosea TaxID=44941 RepID=A0A397V6T9_9GLOM|nr:hypothetical protein C2G38_2247491 [Gigaspora rosea]